MSTTFQEWMVEAEKIPDWFTMLIIYLQLCLFTAIKSVIIIIIVIFSTNKLCVSINVYMQRIGSRIKYEILKIWKHEFWNTIKVCRKDTEHYALGSNWVSSTENKQLYWSWYTFVFTISSLYHFTLFWSLIFL